LRLLSFLQGRIAPAVPGSAMMRPYPANPSLPAFLVLGDFFDTLPLLVIAQYVVQL